jgi:transcriptional accessory protein Tex/SPT6
MFLNDHYLLNRGVMTLTHQGLQTLHLLHTTRENKSRLPTSKQLFNDLTAGTREQRPFIRKLGNGGPYG